MDEIIFTNKIDVKLVQKMGGDHMVVAAAKVSLSSDEAIKFSVKECNESNFGFINYLMKHRHGTPFEHSAITFFVQAPIFVWREWHRHRIGFSYNETSGRYSELKPIFWIPAPERPLFPIEKYKPARPEFINGSVEDYDIICRELKKSYIYSYETYKNLLKRGYAKEIARAVLPVGIMSTCWVTCNPRSLMSFLSLRTHDKNSTFVSYPQYEIEIAARIVEKFLMEGWPLTYKAFNDNGRVAP